MWNDPARNPTTFKKDEPLVMARFAPLFGKPMHPGDPIDVGTNEGQVPVDTAIRLWITGFAVYAKNYTRTPVIDPAEENPTLVVLEDLGGGWYLITAPWMPEGEKVQGKDAAEARRQEIVDKGDTKGVTVTGGAGGWYVVDAPWLDEPEKVQGQDAANARADELITEGVPDGWAPLTDEQKAEKLEAEQKAQQEEQDAATAAEQAAQAAADRKAANAALVTVAPGTGDDEGKFVVVAPWLPAPQVVDTEEAANDAADAIREAGAPDGWTAPAITEGEAQQPVPAAEAAPAVEQPATEQPEVAAPAEEQASTTQEAAPPAAEGDHQEP